MSGPSHLVVGYGNPGRLDDGLGPALAERVELAAIPGVDTLALYQLQIEHATDVAAHDVVLFADAAIGGPTPYTLRRLLPRSTVAFSTHALAPEAVLAIARDTLGWRGRAFLLALRGCDFDAFGERLSPQASTGLDAALAMLLGLLRSGGSLDSLTTHPPTDNTRTLRNGGAPCKTASP